MKYTISGMDAYSEKICKDLKLVLLADNGPVQPEHENNWQRDIALKSTYSEKTRFFIFNCRFLGKFLCMGFSSHTQNRAFAKTA